MVTEFFFWLENFPWFTSISRPDDAHSFEYIDDSCGPGITELHTALEHGS